MRFGYWMPVFGGWLRNIPDEGMEASWDYVKRLTQRSEETGWDLSPDRRAQPQRHQGRRAARARRLVDGGGAGGGDSQHRADGRGAAELPPAGLVRQGGGEHRQHLGRPAGAQRRLVLVGGRSDAIWPAVRPARRPLCPHDRMAAGGRRPVDRRNASASTGERYRLESAICAPKPVRKPRPTIYAGGESDAAKTMIATLCDAYVMHGDPVDAIEAQDRRHGGAPRQGRQGPDAIRHGRLRHRPRQRGRGRSANCARITQMPPKPPKGFDNFDQWLSGTELERELKLQEYSVSNRGLRPNLVGTPEQVQRADRGI